MNWKLIDNTSHRVSRYPSRRALQERVQELRESGVDVRKSPTDDRTYYIPDVGYVPG